MAATVSELGLEATDTVTVTPSLTRRPTGSDSESLTVLAARRRFLPVCHVQLRPGPGMIMRNLLFRGNTGEVYDPGRDSELAQLHAGKDVSPVPIFLSSDATLLTKKLGGHPIICES